MDDAEHNLESVGARPLNAATELLATPSTRAVLDRDDAAAPWAEPPLTGIHMPESRGNPLTLFSNADRFIQDPLVEIAKGDLGRS